ncbi:hypothetical protein CUJ84_pRLN2000237 (plasmid) [Rhizobium leguminosarum]|uniref:DUF3175 domain-containing protein n=2 Tax=Rhizobium leguminosarum TaxID=384 RepID=A0A2K9ZFG2_RHILE|nr:hypothetical protein CUJ84_pRLN2000237 [Rhizobium leguminosarum]
MPVQFLCKPTANQRSTAGGLPPAASGKRIFDMVKSKKKWSQDVTEHSDAMDLKEGVFKSDDPKKIARSVKHSAEESDRGKSSPYRAAMSMLTFYINRAGDQLTKKRRGTLEKAKDELRKDFGRQPKD